MVPIFWLLALTKTVLCVMLAIALSFINTDLATTSLDSEDWQQVVTLGE